MRKSNASAKKRAETWNPITIDDYLEQFSSHGKQLPSDLARIFEDRKDVEKMASEIGLIKTSKSD